MDLENVLHEMHFKFCEQANQCQWSPYSASMDCALLDAQCTSRISIVQDIWNSCINNQLFSCHRSIPRIDAIKQKGVIDQNVIKTTWLFCSRISSPFVRCSIVDWNGTGFLLLYARCWQGKTDIQAIQQTQFQHTWSSFFMCMILTISSFLPELFDSNDMRKKNIGKIQRKRWSNAHDAFI